MAEATNPRRSTPTAVADLLAVIDDPTTWRATDPGDPADARRQFAQLHDAVRMGPSSSPAVGMRGDGRAARARRRRAGVAADASPAAVRRAVWIAGRAEVEAHCSNPPVGSLGQSGVRLVRARGLNWGRRLDRGCLVGPIGWLETGETLRCGRSSLAHRTECAWANSLSIDGNSTKQTFTARLSLGSVAQVRPGLTQ